MRRVRRVLVRQFRPRPSGRAVQVQVVCEAGVQSFLIMPGETTTVSLTGWVLYDAANNVRRVTVPVTIKAQCA